METHRIKVKIGDAEFEAEGPTEIVQGQFDSFLAAIASIPKQAPAPANPAPATPAIPGQSVNGVTPPPQAVGSEILARVFREGDYLSLAALPTGDNIEGSAMLALLYGYLKLKNENAVTGTMLNKSAKISGVNIDRVDRVMGTIKDLVLMAGVKKARRYQLNNRGLSRAEEVINQIVQ